jgi:hypothetical protein
VLEIYYHLYFLRQRLYVQDAVLNPFTTFIHLMEQTRRPTISLVLPMVNKMIAMLDPSRMLNVVDYSSGLEYTIEVRLGPVQV